MLKQGNAPILAAASSGLAPEKEKKGAAGATTRKIAQLLKKT